MVTSPGFRIRFSPVDRVSSISPSSWMTMSRLTVRCKGLDELGGRVDVPDRGAAAGRHEWGQVLQSVFGRL